MQHVDFILMNHTLTLASSSFFLLFFFVLGGWGTSLPVVCLRLWKATTSDQDQRFFVCCFAYFVFKICISGCGFCIFRWMVTVVE